MSTLFCTFFETRTFPLLPSLFFRQLVPSYRLFHLGRLVHRSPLDGLFRRENYETSPFRARGVQKNFCFSEISGKFFGAWAANSLLTANYALLFLCLSLHIGARPGITTAIPSNARYLEYVQACPHRNTPARIGKPVSVPPPYLLPSPQPAKGKYSVNLAIPAAHPPFPAKLHPMRQVQEVSKKAERPTGCPAFCYITSFCSIYSIWHFSITIYPGYSDTCCTSPGKHVGCIAAQALV